MTPGVNYMISTRKRNHSMFSVMRGVRAVLFDLDGTLLDSAPDLAAAADQLRVRGGLPSLPLSHYRAHAGAGARGMLRVAFDIGPEHADLDQHRLDFFDLYERSLTERTVAFEGVDALLTALQVQGPRLGRGDQQGAALCFAFDGRDALV